MDIAALSMAMSQNKVMQQASVSVAKHAMDVAETQMNGMMDMIESATPNFGHQLNIKV